MSPPVLLDPRQLQRILNYLGWGPSSPQKDAPRPVRVGVLGASSVATYAVLNPARSCGVDVVAVAARDPSRAAAYAKQHSIPRVHDSYEALLCDPNVDAVYVGLPNALHGRWTSAALRAGKHVLCEKPFATNAAEAKQVQALARKSGLLCREAFHYRDHPLMQHMLELVQQGDGSSNSSSRSGGSSIRSSSSASKGSANSLARGGSAGGGPRDGSGSEADASAAAAQWAIGPLQRLEVDLLIPKWVFGSADIRWQESLAGGAMMDAGCYCANVMRTLSGGAQPTVVSAVAQLTPGSASVDAVMTASLRWPAAKRAGFGWWGPAPPAPLVGTLRASLQYDGLVPVTEIRAHGSGGSLVCRGFVVPFFGHSVTVTRAPTTANDGAGTKGAGKKSTVLRFYGDGQRTTYQHQLDRFAGDVRRLRDGDSADTAAGSGAQPRGRTKLKDIVTTMEFDQQDSIANMQLIDAVYTASGLPLRKPM